MKLIIMPLHPETDLWAICDISYVAWYAWYTDQHNISTISGTPDDPPEDYINNLFYIEHLEKYLTIHEDKLYILYELYFGALTTTECDDRDKQLYELIQSGLEPYQAFEIMAL